MEPYSTLEFLRDQNAKRQHSLMSSLGEKVALHKSSQQSFGSAPLGNGSPRMGSKRSMTMPRDLHQPSLFAMPSDPALSKKALHRSISNGIKKMSSGRLDMDVDYGRSGGPPGEWSASATSSNSGRDPSGPYCGDMRGYSTVLVTLVHLVWKGMLILSLSEKTLVSLMALTPFLMRLLMMISSS